MKKLGDMMKELGFNPDSAPGAQEAFLKTLIHEAYGVEIPIPTDRRERKRTDEKKKNVQLSFDLHDLVPIDELCPQKKKVSG
jgi:hypothetical protein